MLSLLLNLFGPQSWGTSSYFKQRDAGTEPTKSAIFGMIESAMGLQRTEVFPDLTTLRFGVREDRRGYLEEDFQTAQSVAMARGTGTKNEIIYKAYLADAHFMVVLEGADEILLRVYNALRRPKRAIHLGRRAFSPLSPIILPDSLQYASLEAVLESYPWCASHLFTWSFAPPKQPLRVVIDNPYGFEARYDYRLGVPADRQFTMRRVRSYTLPAIWAEPVRFSMPKPEPIPNPAVAKDEPMVPEQLYESVLRFRNPVFEIDNYNNLHKLVLTALGGKSASRKIPVLFRFDTPQVDEYLLRVRSDRPAAWQKTNEIEIVDEHYRKYDLKLMTGDAFLFDIRVSPVKKRSGRKIRLTDPVQQLAWFKRRATQFCGFEISVITRHTVEASARVTRGRHVTVMFSSVVFTGTGVVTDARLFEMFLWHGLAPNGRFAGFGMPLVHPLETG